MSFVDSINEKHLKKLEIRAKDKKTGEEYPVHKFLVHPDGDMCVLVKTEEEQIKEHKAKGGHYCSSCGQVFYDEWKDQNQVDIIIEKFVIE